MISTILKEGLRKNPHKIAIYEKDKTFSYEELDQQIGQLAEGMKKSLRLEQGDVLAIQASNRIEFVWTLYACWRLGVAITTMNPALKPDEIKHQLENSNAKCFFYENSCKEKAAEAMRNMEIHPVQVLLDGPVNEGEIRFLSLFTGQGIPEQEIDQEAVALIIYTSGTTGKPKGVLLTHRNVVSMIHGVIESLHLQESDRSYLILPLFHVNSIHFTLSAPIYLGASVVLTNRFDPNEFLRNVEQFKPTYTVGVPTVYKLLADFPAEEIQKYDLSPLKFGLCGGAPLTESEFHRFQQNYPFQFLEAWGLSEAAACSTSNPLHGTQKIGSIGIPLPGQQVKVVDEQGGEVPRGERGELIVKGDVVMAGYLNNPKATEEALRDGWLYTGDIGYEDEDGYFYLVGRKKDVIIRGGINIYPKQIEEVLYEISSIKEAAVVGIPDEKYGEEVVAYVSVHESDQLSEEAIITYCKEKMANYKCPVKIYFLDALPKNSVGKIVKHELGKITV
ncbi:AMP-dependent synthetase and ligase [Bacillus sp. OxB-1]|uniref:class I adenylate-forming enzyme family protein n=1 Tax=Bacillus sp. (strain OxB-1) TaxID=98228 RepID=UPI0005822A3B|nr:AMP-binding protein [Bacillus sp. OxB-1]BAQ09074.1 AMP-dependent synthetase and ligase [Bacillus sp. OxB-1]